MELGSSDTKIDLQSWLHQYILTRKLSRLQLKLIFKNPFGVTMIIIWKYNKKKISR